MDPIWIIILIAAFAWTSYEIHRENARRDP